METNIELLPCPFCGSTDLDWGDWSINCLGCPAKMYVTRSDPVHAAKLWNARAPVMPLEGSSFVVHKSKFFKEVAEVIGEDQAFQEISKISELDPPRYCDDLHGAFVWENTPQGILFWDAISRGENPYAH